MNDFLTMNKERRKELICNDDNLRCSHGQDEDENELNGNEVIREEQISNVRSSSLFVPVKLASTHSKNNYKLNNSCNSKMWMIEVCVIAFLSIIMKLQTNVHALSFGVGKHHAKTYWKATGSQSMARGGSWSSTGGMNTNMHPSSLFKTSLYLNTDSDDNGNPNESSTSTATMEPDVGSTSSSYTNEKDTNPKFNLGEWEAIHGNYLLRPPSSSPHATEPRALIHFLGGAIVGAAPDITYRYILEKLADNGFLVVSTPYTLSFDYITTCDEIITKFERIAPTLAQQYGPIPVIGVGHSCGSLLHLLITTLFPDTPRAANVLISYNNKGIKDAVPFFEEVVAPLFTSLGDRKISGDNSTESEGGQPSSSTEMLYLGIELSRSIVQGIIPTDEALTNFLKKSVPKPFSPILPKDIQLPSVVRDSIKQILEPLVKAKSDAGITPLLDQSLDVLEQIPSLIQEVADGAKDFNPTPASVRAAARRAYRARRTLIIQYDEDTNFDESEEIESLLKEAETVMKNKRPMIDFDVQRVVLKGQHATPCIAPPLDLATKAENLVGEDMAKNKLLYQGADDTVDEVVKWLEEGNL